MKRGELVSVLQQIKAFADQAIRAVGHNIGRRRQVQIKQPAKPASTKNLSFHILRIRDAGFFNEARTAKEVHSKIKVPYPCDLNRVAVALVRLRQRKKLRKTSKIVDKRKLVSYVW